MHPLVSFPWAPDLGGNNLLPHPEVVYPKDATVPLWDLLPGVSGACRSSSEKCETLRKPRARRMPFTVQVANNVYAFNILRTTVTWRQDLYAKQRASNSEWTRDDSEFSYGISAEELRLTTVTQDGANPGSPSGIYTSRASPKLTQLSEFKYSHWNGSKKTISIVGSRKTNREKWIVSSSVQGSFSCTFQWKTKGQTEEMYGFKQREGSRKHIVRV